VRFCRASRGRARWRSGRAETGGRERGHSRPQGASTVPRQAGSRPLRSRGPVEALGGARHRRNPRPRPRRQPRRFDAARREEGEASPFSRAQCLGMRDCCRLPSRARENNNLLAGAIIRSEHPDRSSPRWRHLLIWVSCASSPARPCCQSGKKTMYAGIQVSHNFCPQGVSSCFFGLVHGNDVILVLGLSICICAVELRMYVSVMWRLEYFII